MMAMTITTNVTSAIAPLTFSVGVGAPQRGHFLA